MHYIHNHKENVSLVKDDASHRDTAARCCSTPSSTRTAASREAAGVMINSHLPNPESCPEPLWWHRKWAQTRPGPWPGAGPNAGVAVVVWASAPGCFMFPLAAPLLQPAVLRCTARLKYPFPSPLALSFTLWIAPIPNIIEDYYNLPS